MKEARGSDSRLLYEWRFIDEQDTLKSWTNTGVTFSEGKAVFNGSSYLTNKTSIPNGTYSVRIKCNISSWGSTPFFFDCVGTSNNGTGQIYINTALHTLTSSGGTAYVNGVALTALSLNTNIDLFICGITLKSGTGTNFNSIGCAVRYLNSIFTGSIDLIQIYKGTLTASEVSNLYNNRSKVPFKSLYPEILNVNAIGGVIVNRANSTVTNTAVSVVRSGAAWGMAYNGSTSLLSCGTAAFTDATFVCFATFYGWGESNAGRLVDNGKFKVYISSTNNRVAVTSDGSTTVYSATNSIVIGTPYMITVTRKADGKASVYLATRNSAVALSGSADQASGTPATGTTAITFGNDSTGAYTMNGVSKQWMLTGGILSLAELTQIWSSNKHLL